MTRLSCESDPNPRARQPAPSRRRLLAACAGVALLSLGCAPAAYADGRLVTVDIVDRDTGAPLRVWRDHGRPVVAGRPGARYAVRVTNRTGERVLAVVAIDGVNIVTGQTAASDQDGYVLAPYERASLTGWRKSHTEVADFEFTSLENSYAARTGRPDDVGVIGVAVFRESRRDVGVIAQPDVVAAAPRARTEAPLARDAPAARAPAANMPPPAAPVTRADAAGTVATESARGQADARLAKSAPQPADRLGTGHGDREYSYVTDTAFERLTVSPEDVVRIRYDSFANLVAAGIVPRSVARAQPPGPRAFPGDPEPGFVADPPAR